MRGRITEEEKVAKKISDLISDVRLDLETIGIEIATSQPNLTFRRLSVIMDTAEQEKEDNYGNHTICD